MRIIRRPTWDHIPRSASCFLASRIVCRNVCVCFFLFFLLYPICKHRHLFFCYSLCVPIRTKYHGMAHFKWVVHLLYLMSTPKTIRNFQQSTIQINIYFFFCSVESNEAMIENGWYYRVTIENNDTIFWWFAYSRIRSSSKKFCLTKIKTKIKTRIMSNMKGYSVCVITSNIIFVEFTCLAASMYFDFHFWA